MPRGFDNREECFPQHTRPSCFPSAGLLTWTEAKVSNARCSTFTDTAAATSATSRPRLPALRHTRQPRRRQNIGGRRTMNGIPSPLLDFCGASWDRKPFVVPQTSAHKLSNFAANGISVSDGREHAITVTICLEPKRHLSQCLSFENMSL